MLMLLQNYVSLHGHLQRVNVNVLNGQIETFDTTPVEFILKNLEGTPLML